jgi:hypothetical protein
LIAAAIENTNTPIPEERIMKNNLKNYQSLVIMTVIIVGLTIVTIPGAWAGKGNSNPRVIPPHANAFGKSYSEWSAQWWKWQLSLPAADHPAFSTDGANCDAGQSGKVWFLTGAFTNEFPDNEFFTIIRELCSVPTGKAIFFPIVNIECSTIEGDPYRLIVGGQDDNVDTCAAKFVEGPFAVIQDLSVTIDGRELEDVGAYRAQSPVFSFEFEDPNENILGVDCSAEDCDNALSVSDGYWIMLPPLSRGEHIIRFTGSFRDPETDELFFGLDVTYELTVVGGRK